MNDTPLGQVVRIRSESNKDIIKNFTSYEKELRREWNEFRSTRTVEKATEQDKLEVANYFRNIFANMLGNGGEKQ